MRVEPEVEEPLREPLQFDIQLNDVSPEYVEVVVNVRRVAEQFLFHWKTFPIVLPPSVSIAPIEQADSSRKKCVNLKDLFLVPSFDEVDTIAVDAKGDPCRLTGKQLTSIQEWGEFEVESLNFPGQSHRWQLSQILQKGSCRTHVTLLEDVALALRTVIITGWNRIQSPFFSLSESASALQSGLWNFGDALLGLPALASKNLSSKLKEERSKFLVAELLVPAHLEEELELLCQFIKQQIQKQKMEKYRLDLDNMPSIPYLYLTPQGININLKLFNKDLMKKALPRLAVILEKEAKGWFLHFREMIVSDLKVQKLPDAEIEKRANIAVADEYLRRVYGAIVGDPEINALGPGIGQLLIEHAHSIVLMHRAIENVHSKWGNTRDKVKENLASDNPIQSRIGPWVQKKLEMAEAKFIHEHQWAAHEEALAVCRENQLHQTAYFLHRDLVFMREREPVLLKELSRVKHPMRDFCWRTPIWFPKNWVVKKVYQGEALIVPTILRACVTSTGTASRSDPSEPVYLIEKQVSRTTSTCWPFWRWINYFYRIWTWLWNAMFLLGVVIPWCSPVSYRALLSFLPFMPDLEPCNDGSLAYRRSSVTHTLCSRLISLWRHISKSRTEFETRPDRGFIGKGFTRHINRLWNYLVKGVLGTLVIALLFPIGCTLISTASLLTALTSVFWIPPAALLFHLCCIFVYDFDSPDPSRLRWFVVLEALVWKLLIQGLLQPLFAIVVATVACPIASCFILSFAMVRWGLRRIWDALMFHAIIKKRGRIPAGDGFLVGRVAGPGMTSKFYYQIIAEQALAAFEAKMELDELNAYSEEAEQLILRPQQVFSEFVCACFQPFSASLNKEGIYQQLEKEAEDLRTNLREKVDRRKRELSLNLSVTIRSKVKMTAADLKVTIKRAAIFLEKFYPGHVINRLTMSEEEFWEEKGLTPRDWSGLANQILAEIFSQETLVPLQDDDAVFRMTVKNVNLSRFTEVLHFTDCNDDLDVIGTVHAPKGNIHVHSPYLNVAIFNPVSKKEATGRQEMSRRGRSRIVPPWKTRDRGRGGAATDKIKVPLPLPHPVVVVCYVYNREADDAIPTEGELCRTILRATEEAMRPISDTVEFAEVHLTPANSQRSLAEEEPQTQRVVSDVGEGCSSGAGYASSSLSNRNSDSAVVNLASSEDITLEPDGDRVIYSHSSYSTTV